MSQDHWRGPVVGSSRVTAPDKEIDHDTARAVIEAYTAATAGSEEARRWAFEAALRAHRGRCPGVSETLARRRVAKILCFAGSAEPLRSTG
jgi:hypothetical protein